MFQFAKKSILKNNRITTAFVCLMLVIAVFVSAVQPTFSAKASTTVTPRYQPPISSEKAYEYYTTKNVYHKCGYGMPNCTCYAYGRIYELLGKEPNLCLYDADQWYDYNIKKGYYPYGQTPKIGAVACWSYGESGHVAVVEAIIGDKIIMSNSAYGYLNFYLSAEDYDKPGNDGWTFQGYIYPGEFTSSGFNGDFYRNIYSKGINFRSGAGLSYNVIDVIEYHHGFVVTETVKNDGYTWGKTTYMGQTGYVALTDTSQLLCKKGTSVNPDPYEPPTTEPPTTVPPTTEPETTVPETKPTEPPSKEVNEFYVVTSEDGLNMRSGAGTSYNRVGGVPYNEQIFVTKTIEADGHIWGYTKYNNINGWCALTYTEKLYSSKESFVKMPFANSKTGIKGDVDGDGVVTIVDATYLQMYAANFLRLSKSSMECGDVTGDGILSISDSTNIQLYVIKMINW